MSAQPQVRLSLVAPRASEWIPAEEVMALTGWSRRTFFRRAPLLVSRPTGRVGGNGSAIYEYLAASLPSEAVIRMAGERSASQLGSEASGAMVRHVPAPLFAGLSAPPSPRVALPNPAHQQQAEERLAILQPILEYSQDPGRYAALRLRDGRGVSSKTKLIQYQAETSGNCERTIKTWLARYNAGGFPALADRQRSDKNTSRWFSEHRDAAYVAAYLYLLCRQSCRVCHETLVREHGMLGIAEEDLPSYETVRAWLKSMPPYLEAYAREGRRAYRERMAPYLSRHYSDVGANEIWVSDHMIHDVEVANDCFPELPWGTPMRLRFTCLLDFHARYVVGYSWCPEGSSRSIGAAIRRAILQHGAPRSFYCDNGKDYLKVARGARPAYLTDPAAIRGWQDTEMAAIEKLGILARLNVTVTHCIVRHPQSKHVERFFRTLHEQFDKRFFQHYTGGAPHLRPDATSAAMEIHRKLFRRGLAQFSTHPPASFFIAACMAWIEEYHHRPHSGEGMNGRSPSEVFAEDRMAAASQTRAIGRDELAILLTERTTRKVRECAVEFNRCRYTYTDAISRDVLHELNEREVIVAYDSADPDWIALLDEGGHILCWAAPEEKVDFAPGDPATQQRIAESMADRRHMEKATRNLVDEIAREARVTGAVSPVEALVQSAKFPQIVAPVLTHRVPTPKATPSPEASAPLTPAQAARLLLEGLRK
jgi:putative transposase